MSINPPKQPNSKLPAFDPRNVPVDCVDSHLPAVALPLLTPTALRQRFIAPPAWEPELRCEKPYLDRKPIHAAVLLPIVMHSRRTVLLTEQTQHLSTHSGQIAFPGGKVDAGDADAYATALREAQEEVGLMPEFIEVLGCMPFYSTGSGFIVTPVIALVKPGFILAPNPAEVADIFEVPLDFLMDPTHHQRHRFESNGVHREWFSMPYQDPTQLNKPSRFIWGATAGILRNFYGLLSA